MQSLFKLPLPGITLTVMNCALMNVRNRTFAVRPEYSFCLIYPAFPTTIPSLQIFKTSHLLNLHKFAGSGTFQDVIYLLNFSL